MLNKLKYTNAAQFLIKVRDKIRFSYQDNFNLEFNVVDHCNNSCCYCSHFSPIASKKEISLDSFEHDLKLLAPIFSGHVNYVHLLGGEPLLHPRINDFIILARRYFKNEKIAIITNGILLKKMPDSFYKIAAENNILIRISTYPIHLDYDDIMKYVQSKGCYCDCFHTADKMFYRPMVEDGGGNVLYNFLNCKLGGLCLQVKEGKLFYCTYSAYVDILNEKFHTSFTHGKRAFLELDKIKSIKDIYKFRARPNQDCRYCLVEERKLNLWRTSTKHKDEWIKPNK